MVGTTLDHRYQIEELLAEGRTGTVYRGRDTSFDRPVVIKVLRPELAQDEEFLSRLRSSAAQAAGLAHPRIVSLYDAHLGTAPFYLVEEYVPGPSLAQRLAQGMTLPVEEALQIAKGLCEALAYGHQQGMVHGDVRPPNILLGGNGEPKLADFGLAPALRAPHLAQSGLPLSAAAYLSPEQAQGQAPESRSDLYSLGVVMYEMLAGRVPFVAETPLAVGLKHVTEAPEPLRRHRPEVPSAVEQTVLKLLAKQPEDRPSSADAVGKALEQALQEPEVSAEEELPKMDPTVAMVPRDSELEPISSPSTPSSPTLEPTRVMATPPPGESLPERSSGEPRSQYSHPAPQLQEGVGESSQRLGRARSSPLGAILGVTVALGIIGVLLWYFGPQSLSPEGKIEVPDVVDLTVAQARKEVEELGLRLVVSTKDFSTTVPGGKIISQHPAAKRKVPEGTEIGVVVSKGPREVVIPDLTGLTPEQARVLLRKNGLMLGRQEDAEDPRKPDGRIIGQTPNAGSKKPKNTLVTVYVNHLPEAGADEGEALPEEGEGGGIVDTIKQRAQEKAGEIVDEAIQAGKEKLREEVQERKERVKESLREGAQRMREKLLGKDEEGPASEESP